MINQDKTVYSIMSESNDLFARRVDLARILPSVPLSAWDGHPRA